MKWDRLDKPVSASQFACRRKLSTCVACPSKTTRKRSTIAFMVRVRRRNSGTFGSTTVTYSPRCSDSACATVASSGRRMRATASHASPPAAAPTSSSARTDRTLPRHSWSWA